MHAPRITKLSLFFLMIALAGLMGTTVHYHAEVMACLEHGNIPHYTENTQLCPVNGLHLTNTSHTPVIAQVFLTDEEPLHLFSEDVFIAGFYAPHAGRSPPFMV